MPKVTVLMPLFNGKDYVEESLKSVQAQTFSDWEFIIVNDAGSDDGCADVVRAYAEKDPRILLVQAETRLGLAASLNLGLGMAKGEYVARVDVDDPSEPERLKTQVDYMDAHPELSLCSTWQRSVTPTETYIQKVAFEEEELKAAMMFGCEISHCGVMLRKADFDKHGWRYDPAYLGEDYELWTRILMEGARMANIPEPLVSHRWGFGNISIEKGERLREEVRRLSARMVGRLGVQTGRYDPLLFSGWRNRPDAVARKQPGAFLRHGYQLLQEIYKKNQETKLFFPEALHKVLCQRWDWVRESCGLKYAKGMYGKYASISVAPTVSVVLPAFRSAMDISQAIDSIQAQTYTDWELLVVNDADSDDGTAEIVRMYAWNDPRIRLLQAETRLGLAESLNWGMREARGKYIARIDADDTSAPERFAKQIAFMEKRPDVGVCGTWQHHYGKGVDWVHRPTADEELLRCRLLFWCDLCHSTLMLRRDVFISHQLFYDPKAGAEDYELWTRALEFTRFANIPEVLGDYKEGTGITAGKLAQLAEESGQIVANALERLLGMKLSPNECRLLSGWTANTQAPEDREQDLRKLQDLLRKIYIQNRKLNVFDSQKLLQTLAGKWNWFAYHADWRKTNYSNVKTIEDALSDQYRPSLWERYHVFCENNPAWSVRIKKIGKKCLKLLAHPVRRCVETAFRYCMDRNAKEIEHWTWDRYERIAAEIEHWTWDRYERIAEDVWAAAKIFSKNDFIPANGEKIRILFLFQMGSFWPSWESFYNACVQDGRIEVLFTLVDEQFGDVDQMHTNKEFLIKNKIPFEAYTDELLFRFCPHVVIMQTPYDQYHRASHVKSNIFAKLGIRIVYITYGIEITDTPGARKDHFMGDAVLNSWRVYTFSRRMQMDYLIYSPNGNAARCFGHPKFDGLFEKSRFHLSDSIKSRSQGKKIILWHVHFPKLLFLENGVKQLVTPDLSEYEQFALCLKNFADCFFVFLPHPKFWYGNMMRDSVRRIQETLANTDNAYIDLSDDYRPSLVNADAIISDRSALMVEAAAVDVPVLYMSNAAYQEPLSEAVRPLIETYEQGHTCADMVDFVYRCREGLDANKQKREEAFRQCIPYFDGKSGERIKNDIIESIGREADVGKGNLADIERRLERIEKNLELLARR